jgi:hypothetical protein
MVLGLSYRTQIHFTPYKPAVWRGLLWHTGKNLPGHTAYGRNKITINTVQIGSLQLTEVKTVAELDNKADAYCVSGNYVYARFRQRDELPAYASAQEWLFNEILMLVEAFISDRDFQVQNGLPVRYGVTSEYKIKMSAEPNTYGILKFNSYSLSFLRGTYRAEPYNLLGNTCKFYSDDLAECYESVYIENIVYNFDTVNLSCKDIRSKLSDNAVDQQFKKSDYINEAGNIVIDDDVAKQYKADAAGYCSCVPGYCVNGYAFDSQNYRKYRLGYGKIEVDYYYAQNSPDNRGVEVEIENGWRVLKKGSPEQANCWWEETVSETLPNGLSVDTTLICVPVLVAHPPSEGFSIPDLEATPRRIRATGVFHSELGASNIIKPRFILKYLFERYSSLPYEDYNFNIGEINGELAILDNAPCGIYIDKPAKLFNVVGDLQNGSVYGWQLAQYRGLLTARADDPNRVKTWDIKASDIMNISGLETDCDGTNYASSVIVKYSKNYSEDTAKEYIDTGTEERIVSKRGVRKTKTVDTLLKNEADAKIRYSEEIRGSVNVLRSVAGIKLFGNKWDGMRVYDTCSADISIPGGAVLIKGKFKIMSVEKDLKKNVTTIGVKEAA